MSYTMKSSGVDWIGDIPAHWEVKRVKDICSYVSGDTPDTKNASYYSSSSEKGYPWLTIGDLGSRYVSEAKNYISLDGVKSKNMVLQEKGTLLMSFKLSVGLTSITDIACYTNEAIAAFKGLNTQYWYYCIGLFCKKNAKENIYGAPLLNKSLILNALLVEPSQEEQHAIAQFLDDRTSVIDSKIEALKEKEDSLVQLRKSIIHEAVTKGLDPKVPMKASGVDWIGDIPAHWEVKRVKGLYSNLGGGNYGEPEENGGAVLPCISISDFKHGDIENTNLIKLSRSYQKTNTLYSNTILIEKSGGGEKTPVGRIIYIKKDVQAYYTNFVQGIKIRNFNPRLMTFILKFVHLNKLHMNFVAQTTGLQNFNFSEFASKFLIAAPPLSEQRAIAAYLDERTSLIDESIATVKNEIEALQELRKSLIHEALTGKLNVADFGYTY